MSLDKDSQILTVFLTPWGRYKFFRAPMGLVSTVDEFCRIGDDILLDVGKISRVVDDSLVYDDTFPEHIVRLWNVLNRCREKEITINSKKRQFAQPEVNFVGYQVGVDGIKAGP